MIEAYMESTKKGKIGAYLYLDLDDFKQMNDANGRTFCDRVLTKFAGIISNNIRNDDIAARIGGDEFIIFFKDMVNETVVNRQIERLFEALQTSLEEQDCSISIGVSLYPRDGEDLKTLEDHADQALYQAKNMGKNQYFIYESEQ
jgi:diguanylate cyclase (GGDEF)-like protein